MSPVSHHSYQLVILAPSQLACDTLAASLRCHQPLPVCACATTVAALLPYFMVPTILLLDATPGVEMTLPLIRHLSTFPLPPRILIWGVPDQPELIMRYVEAGVRGYLLQNESFEMLLGKVHAVTYNHAIISPTIAAMLIDRYQHYHRVAIRWHGCVTRLATLTRREREVFALIGQGFTNTQIADALVMEYGTVKNYVHHILTKVACSTRAEVVALYQKSLQPFPSLQCPRTTAPIPPTEPLSRTTLPIPQPQPRGAISSPLRGTTLMPPPVRPNRPPFGTNVPSPTRILLGFSSLVQPTFAERLTTHIGYPHSLGESPPPKKPRLKRGRNHPLVRQNT